jgi:hypothetical protein
MPSITNILDCACVARSRGCGAQNALNRQLPAFIEPCRVEAREIAENKETQGYQRSWPFRGGVM